MTQYQRLAADGTVTLTKNVDAIQSVSERTVGHDYLPDGVQVSTILLVVRSARLPFETMVAGGKHDDYCARYATLHEAAAGHARIVAALREGRHPAEAFVMNREARDVAAQEQPPAASPLDDRPTVGIWEDTRDEVPYPRGLECDPVTRELP